MSGRAPVRRSNWRRFALVSAFGAGAFAISASLSFTDEGGAVVEAVHRPSAPHQSALPVLAGEPSTPHATPPPEPRLTNEISHNPFGELNLKAPAPAELGSPASTRGKPMVTATIKPETLAATPPPAPPVPAAPPLPFVAIGSIDGADAMQGQPAAFLLQRETLLVVRKGEAIGQLYRVESITQQKIEFTYIPLMQRQSLVFAQ